MKHLNFLRGALVSLCILFASSSFAYDFEVDGIFYTKISNSSDVAVTECDDRETSYIGDVVIPSSVTYEGTTYNVTRIYGYAFEKCKLNSIQIPNSVDMIGSYAFKDCPNLTKVDIPDKVYWIETGLFKNCSKLQSVKITNNVNLIREYAFSGCSSLTSIEIPSKVTSIGTNAFSGCSSLSELIIQDSWNAIQIVSKYSFDIPFEDCPLKNIYIGRNYYRQTPSDSSISYDLFAGYYLASTTCLESVTIGDKVTTIRENSFISNENLTTINIGKNVSAIERSAFWGCTKLTSLEIPNRVTSIGENAFSKCTGLTSLEIPGSVTSIGKQAFYECTNLSEFSLADGYGELLFGERRPFSNIPLKKLHVGRNYRYEDSSSNVYFNMFSSNSLETLTIGNTVTSIGASAFYQCKNLTSVIISNSVISIEESAFYGCSNLSSVEIGNEVSKIGQGAFSGCSFSSLEIPASVTEIGSGAFSGCSALKDITCLGVLPSVIIDDTFDKQCFRNVSLLVPKQVMRAYKSATGWECFENISGIDVEGVTNPYTDSYDFMANGIYYKITDFINLEVGVTCGENEYAGDVVIPDVVKYKNKSLTVASVGGMFGCWDLKSVKLPATAKIIEVSALRGCKNLTKLEIPASVTRIEPNAFTQTASLSELTIKDGTEKLVFADANPFANSKLNKVYIGRDYGSDDAGNHSIFSNSSSLRKVVLGNNVTSIPSRAFQKCNNLNSVDISNSVVSIGSLAFEYCYFLKSIKIPGAVESVGGMAFKNCSRLDSVIISGGAEKIVFEDSRPFTDCIVKSLYLGRDCVDKGAVTLDFSNTTTLEKITVGTDVSVIAEGMFKGCTALKDIYSENPAPCTMHDAFDKEHYLEANVYIPTGSMDAYQTADGWKSFWNIEEYVVSGIDNVTARNHQSTMPKSIYTLGGKKVKQAIPGNIYIFVDENGRRVKRLVK